MRAGQPTKYNKGILEKANEYLLNYVDYDDVIPSVIGLSLVLNESRQTIYNWKAAQPPFFDILEKIVAKQHQVLVNKGLSSDFNSNITKLVLGKHGYHDKQEINAKHELTDMTSDELQRKIKHLENLREQGLND